LVDVGEVKDLRFAVVGAVAPEHTGVFGNLLLKADHEAHLDGVVVQRDRVRGLAGPDRRGDGLVVGRHARLGAKTQWAKHPGVTEPRVPVFLLPIHWRRP